MPRTNFVTLLKWSSFAPLVSHQLDFISRRRAWHRASVPLNMHDGVAVSLMGCDGLP
ncbi:hypothetical protein VSR72_32360 [Paraburkholderia sp. JHI869]